MGLGLRLVLGSGSGLRLGLGLGLGVGVGGGGGLGWGLEVLLGAVQDATRAVNAQYRVYAVGHSVGKLAVVVHAALATLSVAGASVPD